MNNIKELCVRRGIEQKELALTIGVSQPTVSDWFNKKKNPSGRRLELLSQYLGVSRAVILGYDADPKAPTSISQMVKETENKVQHGPETQTIIDGILAKLAQLDAEDRAIAESHIDFLLERKKREGKT